MIEAHPRTLDQTRATFALETVRGVAKAKKEHFARLGLRLPTMVLNNGLGQALAYLLADAEGRDSPARDLYRALEQWLCGPLTADRPERVYPHSADLIQALMAGSMAEYQRAQRSALALLAWVRKFVDAYLSGGEQ